MALAVNSQSAPFQATQVYLVTGTVGDMVTAEIDDVSVASITPLTAKMVAGGILFTAQRLASVGGAATITFKDTTSGERIPVSLNLAGDIVANPTSITGQVGQIFPLILSEQNDPNAFASITIDDSTVATIAIVDNAEGHADVTVTLVGNGTTDIQVDDGHFGTLTVQILVGASAPTKNVTIAALEAVIGGVLVSMPQTVVPLLDSSSGYNLSGGYTISLTQDKTYVVTYGIAPAESPTQINVANVVLRPNSQIFTADSRTVQVTAVAVNSTISFSPFSDGSYLKDGVVTVRSLAQEVLDKFSTVDSGPTEPSNPREGELFFNTTTNTFEIFDSGSWIPISLGGFEASLATLTDVALSALADGDVLEYIAAAAKWENRQTLRSLDSKTGAVQITTDTPSVVAIDDATAGEIKINVTLPSDTDSLATLSDVALSGLAAEDFLQFDGTHWTNKPFTIPDITPLPAAGATYRGRMVRVLGDGITTPDKIYVCRERADGTYVWTRFQGRAFRMMLCSADFTPSATGTDLGGLAIVPYDVEENGLISIAWTVVRMRFRVETAGTTTTSVKLQRSTGTGVFANAGYINTASLDLASGVYENSASAFAVGTVNSGDKILPEYTALGTGAAGFTLALDLRES